MKKYIVKPEFVDNWYGGNDYTDELISEDEIKRLAADWGKSFEELMDQVELLEDNLKEYVIYLFDYKDELIDNLIIEGKNEEDAYMRFRHSVEGQNPDIRGVYLRKCCQCELISH